MNKHSYFWRHPDQLRAILTYFQGQQERPISAWSVGCAEGEEPYTLALLLQELPVKLNILATDINQENLQLGRTGCYKDSRLTNLPKHYHHLLEKLDGEYRVPEKIKTQVTFMLDNILQTQVDHRFDLITCRNVLIYFSQSECESVIKTLQSRLNDGGLLALGYAESTLLKHQGLTRLATDALFYKNDDLNLLPAQTFEQTKSSLVQALQDYSSGQNDSARVHFLESLHESSLSHCVSQFFLARLDLDAGRDEEAQQRLKDILSSSTLYESETTEYLSDHGLTANRLLLTVERMLRKLEVGL